MKNFFLQDYINENNNDINLFLKKKYDEADEIYDRRFSEERNQINNKIADLRNNIRIVQECISKKENVNCKLIALTYGNLFFRLAQCQEEAFINAKDLYRKAVSYLGEETTFKVNDELDLLLMLCKGKYFRNTARIGRKSAYDKALDIFSDIVENVTNSSEINQKKIHIYLDALINKGRVKRYNYKFQDANEIFVYIIKILNYGQDLKIKNSLKKCEDLLKIKDFKVPKNISSFIGKNPLSYNKEYLIQALIHIGIILRKERRYDDAIKIFEIVNEIDSSDGKSNIDAQNNLGVCYRKIQDFDKSEEIFKCLKNKGNKFANVNLYKLYLAKGIEQYEKQFIELQENYASYNSLQIEFILGLYYKKKKNYSLAAKLFRKIYNAYPYIARGSIGFKAYYNLAQCMICEKRYIQARRILEKIREILQKQDDIIDIMVEIDYGWCLMQEKNYRMALKVYKSIDSEESNKIGIRNWMRIHNNLAECFIHTNNPDKAKEELYKALKEEKDNRWSKYLIASMELTNVLENKESSITECKNVYESFAELIKSGEYGEVENSGWLISAVLLWDKYKQSKDNEKQKQDMESNIEKVIIKKILYLSGKITMKSYFHLAQFVWNQISENKLDDQNAETLYRCFCHTELVDEGENSAFVNLMESPNFHYFDRKTRAKILSCIVLMYKHILNIKNRCCYTYTKKEQDSALPVHYTKLKTLKILLSNEKDENENSTPKLRLWNTAYMNDSFEGGVFRKLLCHAVESKFKSVDDQKSKCQEVISVLQRYSGNRIGGDLQSDSSVFLLSFSKALNSFQMWNIYADSEKGCAIRFDNDFFDIKDDYVDPIRDDGRNTYCLYEVHYYDNQIGQIKNSSDNFEGDMFSIWEQLKYIDDTLCGMDKNLTCTMENPTKRLLFNNALMEVRAFVTDRLNEIRFLLRQKVIRMKKNCD